MNLTGNCLANIKIEETCVELGLWDTISSDQYERLRPFAYKDAHIIIITLAVDNPSSLESVYEKVWLL
jgi:GTPase SAR1 family protein